MERVKDIVFGILLFIIVLSIPIIIATLMDINFVKKCKKSNGVIVNGTTTRVCVTKEQIKELSSDNNE